MAINITMPALSPTMTEGKLAKWLVKEGSKIKSGDVIAEIETDKATMEVEAVDEGILAKILVAAGTENVAVNSVIGIIADEGEDVAAPTAPAKAAPAPLAPVPAAAAPTVSAPQAAAPIPAVSGPRLFATPLAKRLAKQSSVDLTKVAGTGPRGRIVAHDVEKAVASGTAQVGAAVTTTTPAAKPVAPAPAALPNVPFEAVPHSGMRKTIARRLTEAKATIPHFYLTIDVRLDKLMALRTELNGRAKDRYKLSVNDFIIKALALSLKVTPKANASWNDDAILLYKQVDVSVAVAVPDGLFTPVIRDADNKGLAQISNEMKELATRAKAGKLKPEEYQGGAASISNLGMFGIREFSAVINPPQATILAVGAGEQRPIVDQGALKVAEMMTCTLSCDHRVVDGALGAQLLAAFKGFMEDPLSMLV